ncbi:MAG: precorrin-6y C5,15-methyltransferase (decarboxylating) subunit CbiE [Actinomycetota bacterium]|nr:precorrin-6y C5,15-methyltransferase (decarboxylating) subunit CbiE [Actinomycetota bacterium]
MGIVTVVGIGADGWTGFDAATQSIVLDADVVVGGERHLTMLPPKDGQIRKPWPSPLRKQLAGFLDSLDGTIVALASGDPLVSGVGTTLINTIGADNVEIIPAISSVALASARMKWAAESVEVVSLVGRDPHNVLRGLAPRRRILVLSGDGSTPGKVAQLLVDAGYGASAMTVLSDLGSPEEQRHESIAAAWTDDAPALNAPALNIVAIECAGDAAPLGWTGGLPDEAFEHDGQLTKRDIRASALARLAPQPGQLLWDVGAGAASVAIEWMRAHPSCHAIAIESREDRAKRGADNAARLGVPALRVVNGHAPEALEGLDAPHAIFIGGGATEPGVLEACWFALQTGGRLVVHGVTLETESVLAGWYGELGGELTRLHVEHAAPIGSFTGWKPARAITQWSATKGMVGK